MADPSDEAAYVPALEAASYALRIREPDGQHDANAKSEVVAHVMTRALGS